MAARALDPKSERQILINELLSLALLSLCKLFTHATRVGDRLKVTKLIFLATYSLYQEKHKAFNLAFYRYNHGPFTQELYQIWDDLSAAGFLDVDPTPSSSLTLTDQGVDFGMKFYKNLSSVKENEPFTDALLEIAAKHGPMSTSQILQHVYNMQIKPVDSAQARPLSEIPLGSYLTRPIPDSRAKTVVQIQDRWLIEYDLCRKKGWTEDKEAFEVLALHTPEMVLEIDEALEAAQRGVGRKITFEELAKQLGIR